ncbi:MAG: hypothetical protein EAX95_01145 [Candidatus Thorarchaeota archaeon]|nr:hypothetical protein [Candidatus Thorarchaeota archaeon]
MTEDASVETQADARSALRRIHLQDGGAVFWTLLCILVGVMLIVLLSQASWPYLMVGLFMVGFAPTFAIITVVGAIRGPFAGFLTGYLGVLIYDLIASATIVTLTLPALGYGAMGFITGLTTYDFQNGRSLVKLSILSAVGLVFMTLLITVIGMFVEVYGELVAIGLVMLPLLTVGIPTVVLLTPLFGWLWNMLSLRLAAKNTS